VRVLLDANRWHEACNKRGVRIALKPVQSSSTTLESAAVKSSGPSFLDTLTSASSRPVQRSDSGSSDSQGQSAGHSGDSTPNENQNQNTSAAPQGNSASPRDKQIDRRSGQVDDNSTSAKSPQNAGDRNSLRTASKRTAFTSQVASHFCYQASTAQPQLNTSFGASATTSDIEIAGSNSDMQAQGNIKGPDDVNDARSSRIDRENAGEQILAGMQIAISSSRQLAQQLTAADLASPAQGTETGTAQSSAANADTGGTPPSDPASVLQTNLATDILKGSAIVKNNGDANQPAGTVIQSKAPGSAFGLNSDAANTAETAKQTKNNDGGDDPTSSPNLGATSSPAQHPQIDSAQTAVVAAKGAEGITLQPAAFAAQTESHSVTQTHTSSGSTETATHRGEGSESQVSEQWVGSGSAGMSGINAARLIQTMGESEMRVGMHSSEFGDISIRTAVSQQQMQAQISVDHNELGSALSAHIPSIQAKLGSEYGLHATIHVNQGGTSFSNEGDRSSQQQQKAIRPVEISEAPLALQNDPIPLRDSAVASGEYRLDIRA